MDKISIITPTFNRASFLNDIYNNLSQYNDHIFEWIIIDDGSTDMTKQIVKNFKNIFPIKYFYQKNSGKHVAVNYGMNFVENQYTVILDSDDLPLTNTFNTLLSLCKKIDKDIVGIVVNICDNNGQVLGKYHKNSFSDTIQNAYLKNKVNSDKWIIWKTSFIKRYKFPIYDNEKFVPEGLLYNRISRNGFKLTFFPDILLNARYQNDGYSKNISKLKYNNFNGFMNYYSENIFSESISINKYYLKSLLGLLMLIINKSKKPIIIIFLLFVSLPILIFTLLFYKRFYYNSK